MGLIQIPTAVSIQLLHQLMLLLQLPMSSIITPTAIAVAQYLPLTLSCTVMKVKGRLTTQ